MTLILGLELDGHSYIGADSGIVYQDTWGDFAVPDKKVFRINDNLFMGTSGSIRVLQILKHYLPDVLEPQPAGVTDERYIVRGMVTQIREQLVQYHSMRKDDLLMEGILIVSYKKKIYTINQDFSVIRSRPLGSAIGSGQQFAFGALSILENKSAKKRLLKTFKAAQTNLGHLRPPFIILDSKGNEFTYDSI